MREIDTREPLKKIAEPLVKLGWVRTTLREGQDARFSTLKGQVVGIQRKKVNDFFSSLKLAKGRRITELEKTLLDLKASVDLPVLLIEGGIFPTGDGYARDERGNVYPRKFIAVQMLLSSIEDKGIKILAPFPTSEYHTVQALVALERNYNKLAHRFMEKPHTSNEAVEVLCRLPGIDITRASSLLKEFKSLSAIFSASEKELRKMPKIGPKTAKSIREFWEREVEL